MTRRFDAALICCLLLVPDMASAHTPIKGISNIFNGMLHPVLTPSHLLLLIATSLFLGQKGIEQAGSAMLTTLAAVVLGLAASVVSPGPQVEYFILIWAVITGLLVAASLQLSIYWYYVIGALAGFGLGFDSAQEALSGKEKVIALFGTGAGVYFFSLYPVRLAEFCNSRHWLRVGIRIIGSWIAASSLLVLSLSLSSAGFD